MRHKFYYICMNHKQPSLLQNLSFKVQLIFQFILHDLNLYCFSNNTILFEPVKINNVMKIYRVSNIQYHLKYNSKHITSLIEFYPLKFNEIILNCYLSLNYGL
jgi:branched-subunit amino acid transport protein AzlD